jgi:hypothetical protein
VAESPSSLLLLVMLLLPPLLLLIASAVVKQIDFSMNLTDLEFLLLENMNLVRRSLEQCWVALLLFLAVAAAVCVGCCCTRVRYALAEAFSVKNVLIVSSPSPPSTLVRVSVAVGVADDLVDA